MPPTLPKLRELRPADCGGSIARAGFAFQDHVAARFCIEMLSNTQLGATSQALVLFAYHYALLSLVSESRFNYPGLVLVDFPVELMDSKTIGEGENYLVEPFIELCERLGTDKAQFIAAGRAFLGLDGANRIKLDPSPFKEEPPPAS